MSAFKSREIRLKSRPAGVPGPENFELAEIAISEPGPGQVVVRNSYMSVDPYMRGRMTDRRSYVPGFQIGQPLGGHAVGQVVAAGPGAGFTVGDHVLNMNGWQEAFLSDGAGLQKFTPMQGTSVQAYIGALGMPGMTAYAGLLRIGELKEGERVFVSAATGAVGAIVVQIAKAKGCYVVGSAGSDDKCDYLTKELGADKSIHYKSCGDLNAAVAEAFPEGIDVYFDNVGGAHLQAAIGNMRPFGRIACCGMIDQYNAATPPAGPNNMILIVGMSLTVRGFIVSNHYDMLPDFLRDMEKWIKAGKMKWRESITDGIENAPKAFIGLFSGDNFGKALVRIGPDSAV